MPYIFSTGMFNGLKKMVGKGTDDTPNMNHLHPAIHPVLSNISPNKCTKKRKVVEREYPPNIKKKYEIIYIFVCAIIFANIFFSLSYIYLYTYFFKIIINICVRLNVNVTYMF